MTASADVLRLLTEALARIATDDGAATVTVTHTLTASFAWTPERFWAAPAATQIDASELAEALALSRGAIHRRVTEDGMPCRRTKLGGRKNGKTGAPTEPFIFIIGEVREWLADQQHIVNGYVPRQARPRRLK